MAKANPKTRVKTKATKSKAAKTKATRSKATKTKATRSKATKTKPTKSKPTRSKATSKLAGSTTPTVVATGLSRDGTSCSVVLSTGKRLRMSAAAMHAARIRIGGRWTAAISGRIERFEHEQKAYARALEFLTKEPRLTKAQLAERLGGGRDADAAIASLAELGWL